MTRLSAPARKNAREDILLTVADLHNDVDPTLFDNQLRALSLCQCSRRVEDWSAEPTSAPGNELSSSKKAKGNRRDMDRKTRRSSPHTPSLL